ncbi:potassium channel family protein [Aliiruegeria sabulilitoris]|uniref:potassium channel family protein n=1 Tax=Aliiruegeria sabulilitoris TaxID=1510458 RepID=UPI00082E09B2|nr:potassium channel family protein [Aliiruegeria sabulilitoris]NDR55034.1 two pore domain potassium channel family protein [Pseudoruegeria sp. M32A2M]
METDDERAEIHWGVMLVLLVSAFLLEPLFGSSKVIEVTSLVLFELTIVGSIIMSAKARWLRAAGGALALIWFSYSLLAVFGIRMSGNLAYLTVILVLGALAVTFRILLREGRGNVETLLGAIFGYLLLGMAWAMLYVQIERNFPGSFAMPEGADIWSTMLYFSLVTLTTLGYGDILPNSSLAMMSAGFEAVVGVLYIAVMVGSIVGNLKAERRR